jgi:hypothetical protein
MANTVITPSIIAKVALAQLENNLVFGRSVYRDYDREFNKVGDTIMKEWLEKSGAEGKAIIDAYKR